MNYPLSEENETWYMPYWILRKVNISAEIKICYQASQETNNVEMKNHLLWIS